MKRAIHPIKADMMRLHRIFPAKFGKIRMEIRSMPMVAAFFITMVLTIGMANTRKGKPFCLTGLRGSVIVRM